MSQRTHTMEAREKIRRGHIGKKLSPETKAKISQSVKKAFQDKEFRKKLSDNMKERMRDLSVREHLSQIHRGPNSSNWQGGKSSLKRRVKTNYKFTLWKAAVLKRDHYQCQICHSKEQLHIHHKISLITIINQNKEQIESFNYDIPLLWDINNGITYCDSCHKISHHSTWKNRTIVFLKKLKAINCVPPKLTEELTYLLGEG